MSLNRYDARRDGNEREIVAALRKAGCRVFRADWPDILVQRASRPEAFLLEIKQKAGTLTDKQEAMMEAGWVFAVVRTPEEALKAVGL